MTPVTPVTPKDGEHDCFYTGVSKRWWQTQWGRYQTKNITETKIKMSIGVSANNMRRQCMSTQRNLKESIGLRHTGSASSNRPQIVRTTQCINEKASFQRLSCWTFKSTANFICFVSRSVCPSISLPSSLPFPDTHSHTYFKLSTKIDTQREKVRRFPDSISRLLFAVWYIC